MFGKHRAVLAGAVALTALLAAGAVATAAEIDHRHKQRAIGAANEASWFCQHRHVRCDEPQAADVAGSWHRRERIYRASFKTALVVAAGAGLVAVAVVLTDRRRRTRDPDPR